MEVAEDDVHPAYYPDLSDLEEYLDKGVGVFTKWMCENSSSLEAEFIPPELVLVFDLKPLVNPDQLPLFTLLLTERHIFLGASTAAIHVMELHKIVKLILVNIFSCITEKLKVKYNRVSIFGDQTDYGLPSPYLPMGSAVIIWNARNVHRPSFVETFHRLFDSYAPAIVVVIEAWVDQSMLNYVKTQLRGVYNVDGFGGQNGYSEVLLIWDKADVYPWVTKRGNSYFGHQLGVEIETRWGPGMKAYSVPQYYDDRGDDVDPTIHDWNDQLTR